MMAKVQGPLFSAAAHGSIHTELTYSKRKTHNHARFQHKQTVHTEESQYVMRDKFYAGQILYWLLTLPERIYWDLIGKTRKAEVDYPHVYSGSLGRSRLARIHRNIYLPELLIDKGVPRTNQSVVYYKGDDGTYMTGVEGQVERFVDQGDGTIYDKATGLEWVADPSEIGGVWGTPGTPATMDWYEALTNCKELNYAGHNDWRLPNTKELETLIDYSKKDPSIDGNKFPNTQNGNYWSGSITNHGCDNQYDPNFGNGTKGWDQDKNKKKYVRPVRKKTTGHRSHQIGRRRGK